MKKRILDLSSLGVAVIAIGFVVFHAVPSFRYGLLYAMGRSPNCPFSRAIHVQDEAEVHLATVERLKQGSRIARKEDGLALWETPNGSFWIPEEHEIFWVLAEQEGNIYGSGETGVQPGDVVLDCGASIGLFTHKALDLGASVVLAIDPAPESLKALRRNSPAEIEQGKVVVVEKGVWDREGVLPFDSLSHRVANEGFVGEDAFEIQLTTIDKLVDELGLASVDFIKMDIEGAEQKALAGAKTTLAKHKPRLAIAAYHLDDDQARIPEIVKQARPDYQMECGRCGEREMTIAAFTLLFR